MLHIGCHLSSSKGYRHMGEEALSIKADTFQFFTRNPRGSKAKKANPKDAEALARPDGGARFRARSGARAVYAERVCPR